MKLAYNNSSKNYVAIKFLKNHTPFLENTFINEMLILNKIKHNNLISLISYSSNSDFAKTNGKIIKQTFTVLEFAEGGQLFDYLAFVGPFGEDLARTFFKQLLSGIFFSGIYFNIMEVWDFCTKMECVIEI